MSYSLRIVHFGASRGGGRLPEIVDRRTTVADVEAASRACLEAIRYAGLTRERWVGGIVSDGEGNEIGQVAFQGNVYDRHRSRRDAYALVHASEAEHDIDGDERFPPIRVDVKDHGAVWVTMADDGTAFHYESATGFSVDGKQTEIRGTFAITPEGWNFRWEDCEEMPSGSIEFGPMSRYLEFALTEILHDWAREPENKERLAKMAEWSHAVSIARSQAVLAGTDAALEKHRRAMLDQVLGHLEMTASLDSFDAYGPEVGP